jgi:superfamily II DNA or RNA helicase
MKILPKHPKSKEVLQSGVLNALTSFEQLELRISEISDTKLQGDIFEVFAEAYFATQPQTQSKDVFPFAVTPIELLKKAGVSPDVDMGVDGILQKNNDNISAYQVKFRTGRPRLQWRELSTFMGLTDTVEERILFTNTDDLPEVMNDRTGFYCIRGTDLDRLTQEDLSTILSWIETHFQPIKQKTPYEHQNEALNDLTKALANNNRVTALMACGTGKTLIQLWLTEKLFSKNILVLFPSLALLRQTLHEWLREIKCQNLCYICVCSDETVKTGLDEFVLRQSDLDFPVTTDPSKVRSFLETPFSGIRIVFSTYHSSRVVGSACPKGFFFDIAIFDEAHKTAGRVGADFTYALMDERIVSNKRAFFTATPRHYELAKKDATGDAKIVFSMDDVDTYGPIAHTLSFRKAAKLGIVCEYKIVISVVTNEMVTNDLLNSSEIVIDGEIQSARQAANQISLKKAVEEYSAEKIFTFHRNIKTAQTFTSAPPIGIGYHLPHFQVYHVNGEIPTAKREKLLNSFRNASKAIISNARCLTEGVDVPAVDMVAFMSPRKSRVDIVQAAGRAMRKNPNTGKKFGYILLPIYLELEKNETIEEAINRTNFDEIWNVLHAMAEQDEMLAQTISQLNQEYGEKGDFDDTRLADQIEFLGPTLTLPLLRKAISTRCIQTLGSTWDFRFGELIKYKNQNGNCNPPRHGITQTLGNWVAYQRLHKSILSADRIKKLDSIGFIWTPLQAEWEEMFDVLKEYKQKYSSCNVPYRYKDNPKLSYWVQKQRNQKFRLSEEKIARLEKLGFQWKYQIHPETPEWYKNYADLIQYRNENGHSNVPQSYKENKNLGRWVNDQRVKKDRLTETQIKLLDNLGFIWNLPDLVWESRFNELVAYKTKFGNTEIPATFKEDYRLGMWVYKQRRNKHMLSPDKINKLESIGFRWGKIYKTIDKISPDWMSVYEQLKSFKNIYGNCDVPHGDQKLQKLSSWIKRQRQHKESLCIEKIKMLDELCFDWNPQENVWNEMYRKLQEFKKQFGHCDVVERTPQFEKLGSWVSFQRKKKNKLLPNRLKLLEEIDFIWNPNRDHRPISDKWYAKYEELKQYKAKHGDCLVPKNKEFRKLVNWVSKMRTHYEGLAKEKIDLLNEIGFVWDAMPTRKLKKL